MHKPRAMSRGKMKKKLCALFAWVMIICIITSTAGAIDGSQGQLDPTIGQPGTVYTVHEHSWKKLETRSKPAQMVTKSITMLRDVDTRVVEKLNDVEREKLRQQVSKLSQMVDQFDILFDDGAENDRVPTENADASQSKRYCIAPRSLEDPEVVCTNLGKPVTGLTFSMCFDIRRTDISLRDEIEFIVVILDGEHQKLTEEVKLHGRVGDHVVQSFTLAARASGLGKCFLGIRTPSDKNNELQMLFPITISMMFASDVDF